MKKYLKVIVKFCSISIILHCHDVVTTKNIRIMVTLSKVNRKFKLESGMCIILHDYMIDDEPKRIILFKNNDCGDMWYIDSTTASMGKLEWIEDTEFRQIEVFKSPSSFFVYDQNDKIYDTDLDGVCDETIVLTMEDIAKKFNVDVSRIRIVND